MPASVSPKSRRRRAVELMVWLGVGVSSLGVAVAIHTAAGKPFSATITDPLALPRELAVTSQNASIPLPPELGGTTTTTMVGEVAGKAGTVAVDPTTTTSLPGATTTTSSTGVPLDAAGLPVPVEPTAPLPTSLPAPTVAPETTVPASEATTTTTQPVFTTTTAPQVFETTTTTASSSPASPPPQPSSGQDDLGTPIVPDVRDLVEGGQ